MARLFLIGALLPSPIWAVAKSYTVQEPPDGRGELDSVALWVSADSSSARLYITDKTRNVVEIHDAVENTYIGNLGGSGVGPGSLARPNGIAVAYGVPGTASPIDLLFVVERDNNRVSVFLAAGSYYVGEFGGSELDMPYGIAIYWEDGTPQAWITSTGTNPDRVYVYDLGWGLQGFSATLNRWFPAPYGAKLESITIDPVSRQALVCDEGARSDVMVFDLEGNLLTRFGEGLFVSDPEGIALYDVGEGEGYILVADQQSTPMDFEIFDRKTFASLGRFQGPTLNTDGIALSQAALPNLPNGSLFAIHDDSSLHAYDWVNVAEAMGLCINTCQTTTSTTDSPTTHSTLVSHPNPFNPSTVIRYSIEEAGWVHMRIVDTKGNLVATLVDSNRHPGVHRVVWQGRGATGRPMPSGVYWAQLTAGSQTGSHKLILVK